MFIYKTMFNIYVKQHVRRRKVYATDLQEHSDLLILFTQFPMFLPLAFLADSITV